MTVYQQAAAFARAQDALTKWAETRGHDKCWYYPEIFNELAVILKVDVRAPQELPRLEFERGCERYQKEIYE